MAPKVAQQQLQPQVPPPNNAHISGQPPRSGVVTPPIDYTGLITSLANHHPPSALTTSFRALLQTYPHAVFTPYEIKVICAMMEPSILLPTSPYYDHSIDEDHNPRAVSGRLMSAEFSNLGKAFVEEAVKSQVEKTNAAWSEHNTRLAAMFTDVLAMINQRSDSLEKMMKTHGYRHPMIQVMREAVEQEYKWLDACILDNKEGFEKHNKHLEEVKARSGEKRV